MVEDMKPGLVCPLRKTKDGETPPLSHPTHLLHAYSVPSNVLSAEAMMVNK
jgi:hypothetical protein